MGRLSKQAFSRLTCLSASDLAAVHIPLDLTARSADAYIEACDRALEQLGDHDSPEAVTLLTHRIVVASQRDFDLGADASTRITAMAERVGGTIPRAYAQLAWGVSHPGPEHSEERVRIANQILAVADSAGESALIAPAYSLLMVALLEQGRIRELDVEVLAERCRVVDADSSPAEWFRCLRLILDGEMDAAEATAEAEFSASREEGTTALALYTSRIGMIRWMQGRIDGAEERFLAARRAYPEQLLWPASLAWLWILQGRRTSAETLLRSLPDIAEVPRDRYWLSTLTVLVEIARHTGTRARAEQLRQLLLPFADRLVPVGVGVAFWGTAARSLGLLEEHLGMLDEARGHLELAAEMSARVGALAWHAEAQIELAEFALRHDIADIPAYELLGEARVTSRARGFAMLERRAMHRPRICVLGGFDVVSLCGRRAQWSSRKARELLKMLVAARGVATSREVFMDALWPGEPPSRLGNRFSVALNVIRRALDPERMLPTQHHLVTEGDAVRLELDHLDIDLERFFALGEAGAPQAAALYRGEAFSDEPYADWAVDVRERAAALHRRLTDTTSASG